MKGKNKTMNVKVTKNPDGTVGIVFNGVERTYSDLQTLRTVLRDFAGQAQLTFEDNLKEKIQRAVQATVESAKDDVDTGAVDPAVISAEVTRVLNMYKRGA